jgi:hypothetical protein
MPERKARVGEAVLLRLLRTVAEVKAAKGRWPYTRELLMLLKSWGYGQEVIEEAVKRGLVERFEARCASRRPCVFNKLTEKGEAVLKLMS